MPRFKLSILAAAAATGALLIGPAAHGQTASSRELTLREAIGLALDRSPRLQGHRFALSAVDARRDQAALRPPLTAGIEVENVLGTNRLSALGDSETTLSLGTILERADKRAGRIAVAERERDLIVNTQDVERLDLLAEVSRRFYALMQAQEETQAFRRAEALAQRTRDVVRERIAAGSASSIEEGNADLNLLAAARERAKAEAGVDAAASILSGSWGDAPLGTAAAAPLRAAGDVFALTPVAGFDVLANDLERNPLIARFATQRRLQEASLRFAEAGRVPDVSVSAGVRHLQAARSQAFMLSASIPLQSASRNRAAEMEAQSRLSAVGFEEQAARAELKATLFGLHRQLIQTVADLDSLRTREIPLAQETIKRAEHGYRAGRLSLLDVTNAQRTALALEQTAIAAAVQYQTLLLEIERLTGRAAPIALR